MDDQEVDKLFPPERYRHLHEKLEHIANTLIIIGCILLAAAIVTGFFIPSASPPVRKAGVTIILVFFVIGIIGFAVGLSMKRHAVDSRKSTRIRDIGDYKMQLKNDALKREIDERHAAQKREAEEESERRERDRQRREEERDEAERRKQQQAAQEHADRETVRAKLHAYHRENFAVLSETYTNAMFDIFVKRSIPDSMTPDAARKFYDDFVYQWEPALAKYRKQQLEREAEAKKKKIEEELHREMQAEIDAAIKEGLAAGWSEAEIGAEVEYIKEHYAKKKRR